MKSLSFWNNSSMHVRVGHSKNVTSAALTLYKVSQK